MLDKELLKLIHSRNVLVAVATAIVAVIVALGVPLTTSQQHILEIAIAGIFTTVFGGMVMGHSIAKAITSVLHPTAASKDTSNNG